MSKTKTYALRTLGAFAALMLFAVAAAGTWLIIDDYMRRTELPAGVSIGGHDVSSLDVESAAEEVNEAVATPLMQPVEVAFEGERYTLDSSG